MSEDQSTPDKAAPKKKPWVLRHKIISAFGALIVLFAIIGAFGGGGEPASDADTAPAAAPTSDSSSGSDEPASEPSEKPVEKPKTPQQKIQAAVEEVNEKATVKFNAGGEVDVKWPISDNLTNGMIRTGAQVDTVDFLKAVADSGYQAKVTKVEGTFPMKDQYGNVSTDVILRVAYSGTVLHKINYDNVDHDNIWGLADIVSFVHPELRG